MGEQAEDPLALAVARELERLFTPLRSGTVGPVTEPAAPPPGS